MRAIRIFRSNGYDWTATQILSSGPGQRHINNIGDFRIAAKLNFAWRWFGTALSFAVFGIGSFLLGIVIMPLIVHLVRNDERRERWSRTLAGGAMRFFRFFMDRVGVLDYAISGTEHIEPDRSYLILANHPSLIDVVFLLAMFPEAECVIKQELLENFWTRHLMKGAGYISNQDPEYWMDQCIKRLDAGQSLILFPEGTRTEPGQPLRFKAGAAAVAVRTGSQCLPIVIRCTPTTLTKAEKWYEVPDHKVFVSIQVQPAISAADVIAAETDIDRSDIRGAGRAFNDYLLDYFSKHLDRPA